MFPFLLGLAVATAPPLSPPCRIPKHALVVATELDFRIDIYDRDNGSRACTIPFPPQSAPPMLAVAPDGRIFVVLRAAKETNYSTDAGHVDVIGPDGRLLHRLTEGLAGPSFVALDSRGHLFLSTGWSAFLDGESIVPTGSLAMFDAGSFAVLRRFDVATGPSEYYDGSFALSPDGHVLAAKVDEKLGGSRIDVFDVATGKRTLQIPIPRTTFVAFDGANLVFPTGSRTWQVRSASTGAIVETRTSDGLNRPDVFEGVAYESHMDSPHDLHSLTAPSSQIVRRDVASGRTLPPIAIQGMVSGVIPVDPDPSLASAVAGADVAPLRFPTLSDLRSVLRPDVRGVAFDDAISGKRFAYLGDDVRIDDPSAHSVTIVDCTRQVALIADTAARSYSVVRTDPTVVDQSGVPDQLMMQLKPPASVTYAVSELSRAELHSHLATVGYKTRIAMALGGSMPTRFAEEEREYASGIGAAHPSCPRHSFGGELLAMGLPGAPRLPSAAYVQQSFRPDVASITGTPPAIPSDALLVRVEIGQNGSLAPVFDVRNVHQLSAAAVTQFAIPDGYAEEPVTY